MALVGSPKKLAQDVADGFYMFSPPQLKQYSPADLKTILANLALVARDIRQQQIPLEDIPALKAKNMKLSRLNQAEVVLRAFCKKQRIPV